MSGYGLTELETVAGTAGNPESRRDASIAKVQEPDMVFPSVISENTQNQVSNLLPRDTGAF